MHKDLKNFYKNSIVEILRKEFSYKNIQEVPKIQKVVISRGLGNTMRNSKEINSSIQELAIITGQNPTINVAKDSIAGFKIRENMAIGASVTLRHKKMYALLERLIHIVLPRVRDFRGLSPYNFDGKGNYNFGLTEQLIFPEISYNDVNQTLGLNITIATTAKTDEESFVLLKNLGMPFILS